VRRSAPSYAPRPQKPHLGPAEIVRRFLARFGDRRYIHSITFATPPPAVGENVRYLYSYGHPPADQLKVVIHTRRAKGLTRLERDIAAWETGLVFGALRDDFCSAGGAPLVWASYRVGDPGVREASQFSALEQRFPNPSPTAFRDRVALIAKRFGFRVVTLKLLRPEQMAPLLIVKTSRNRDRFARQVPRIMELLNPIAKGWYLTRAETFEGVFFGAEDAKGPFLSTYTWGRGAYGGSEWTAKQEALSGHAPLPLRTNRRSRSDGRVAGASSRPSSPGTSRRRRPRRSR